MEFTHIKVLLIEDEEIWQEATKSMLEDFGYTLTGIADSFESAVVALNQEDYDIVLVDIRLDGNNKGIELGKMINTLYKKPFIFVTGSYDSHSVKEASIANPSAYLVKPVNPASLFISIQNAINRFENFSTSIQKEEPGLAFLFIKQGNKYKKIFWKDVLSITSDKNYSLLYNTVDKKEYPIRSTLPKTLKWVIPSHLQSSFIQINRSQAIQINWIEEINGDYIKTSFGNFMLGEAYLKQLKERINIQA